MNFCRVTYVIDGLEKETIIKEALALSFVADLFDAGVTIVNSEVI